MGGHVHHPETFISGDFSQLVKGFLKVWMHFEESVRMISYPNLTSYIGFLYNLLHSMYFLLSEPQQTPNEGYPKITPNVQKTPEMNVLSPDRRPAMIFATVFLFLVLRLIFFSLSKSETNNFSLSAPETKNFESIFH